jgi:hypothetical protein
MQFLYFSQCKLNNSFSKQEVGHKTENVLMRENKKIFFIAFLFLLGLSAMCQPQQKVEKWGRFEVSFKYISDGNAFIDDSLTAIFSNRKKDVTVRGFHDGDGIYTIRFMPSETGIWSYKTSSNVVELNGKTGNFYCEDPSGNNHGPIRIRNKYHFAYADGTLYFPFGTTCYSFIHQSDSQSTIALNQLKNSPFNKVRFCVLPQWQTYTDVNPPYLPFLKISSGKGSEDSIVWDYKNLNPDFFRNLERRIDELATLGVEADIILFHPYDDGHWGFDKMSHETDLFYLKYLVARLASFRNVWWSLANEYDFLSTKSLADWESLISTIATDDPYKHLCSIHNGKRYFENWNPNLSHASIQNGALVEDFGRAVILRDAYKKPVIYDEVCYEGDILPRWGNLSGEELTHRFWQGIIAGTYVGHGEAIVGSDSILHLIYGRELRGNAPSRIQFLKSFVEKTGALEPVDKFWKAYNVAVSEKGDVVVYFGENKMSKWPFSLTRDLKVPDGTKYAVDIIDTWNMTITPTTKTCITVLKEGVIKDVENKSIKISNKKYMAIWLRKVITK